MRKIIPQYLKNDMERYTQRLLHLRHVYEGDAVLTTIVDEVL